MNKWIACLLLITISSCSLTGKRGDFTFPSSMEFSTSKRELLIASERVGKIAIVDANGFNVKRMIRLQKMPTGMALSSDEKTLYVSAGQTDGVVYVIDGKRGKVTHEIPVGHSPVSPVLVPDSEWLFVCNRHARTISVVDLTGTTPPSLIPVPGEPVSAALTPDAKFLLVVNNLPVKPANVPPVNAEITVIDVEKKEVVKHVFLPNGSTGLKDIVLSPDGNYAYVTHILAHYEMPTTRVENGWMNANALSVINVQSLMYENTVLLDQTNKGASNPWGIDCSKDGRYLCAAHSGTNELSVIDRNAMHHKLKAAGDNDDTVWKDLHFLSDVREIVSTCGVGPREVLISDDLKLFVANFFSGNLGFIDLEQEHARATSIQPFKEYTLTTVERGEMYFNSGDICFQQWQSCASCHPEGRADGLNWDLMNDGMGNPKNTKSLLLSHVTPPTMSTGIRKDAETAVRAGINYILFTSQPDEVAESIDEYLKSMEPIPSPYLVDGELSESAQRGEKLFYSSEVGCFACHPKPYYTDLKVHDVGTHSETDFTMDQNGKLVPQDKYDTPSLIELWRTGPYLHDGRYATVKEAITDGNHKNRRGNTSQLTDAEVDDLVQFILSM